MYRNAEFLTRIALTSSFDSNTTTKSSHSLFSDIANLPLDPQRHNRLCITISDIHLTDGTVGYQNLEDDIWRDFFSKIADTCSQYQINEVVLVLDGDVIDLIRSGTWAEENHYPWQRENKSKFDQIVLNITKNIIKNHACFFELLKNFDTNIRNTAPCVQITDIVILLGNHDKELMICNEALSYFYEHGLGRKPDSFSEMERAYIGRMFGDRELFLRDKNRVPYFPFYHADKGFRFFTTHGQWRDSENSRAIAASDNKPGWSSKDGWQTEVWEKLQYSPFLDACFGDTVAAGVVSTFIYKTKKALVQENIVVARLNRILDELDLYRPSYLAVKRIIHETRRLRAEDPTSRAAEIVEQKLTECVHNWLEWPFTMQSASNSMRRGLKIARFLFSVTKSLGKKIELEGILKLMEALEFFSHYQKSGVELKQMKKFPGFMPPYSTNGFQIHGEGHTHNPLQEEANLGVQSKSKHANNNFTYVNFGTWRDQIVNRKNTGYRRRGVLRAFNILDLKTVDSSNDESARQFSYFTQDVVIWRDALDRIDEKEVNVEKMKVE